MAFRIILGAAFMAALLVSDADAATQFDWDLCENINDAQSADGIIAGCTRVLSGNETPQDRAVAYANRCRARNLKREHDRAIADCDQAIRLAPRAAAGYSSRGIAWHAKGDLDRSLADFTVAIRLNPKYADLYNLRGLVWQDKRQHDRAIADYTEALRLDPKLDLAFANRGTAWRFKGEFDRALADYTEAIRLNSDEAYFYQGRAVAWQAKGELDLAISDYTAAIRNSPGNRFYFHDRGILWDVKGDLERAIADQTEAIRLNPNFAPTYAQRGYAHFTRLDFSAAAADLLKATELADDARAMLLRHVARARAGENSTTELEANSARLKTRQWPYPIIEMFLGRRSPEATLSAATPSERCVAEFFIGEWHLMRGDPQAARSKWRITVDACPPTSLEYRSAKAELRVLDSR